MLILIPSFQGTYIQNWVKVSWNTKFVSLRNPRPSLPNSLFTIICLSSTTQFGLLTYIKLQIMKSKFVFAQFSITTHRCNGKWRYKYLTLDISLPVSHSIQAIMDCLTLAEQYDRNSLYIKMNYCDMSAEICNNLNREATSTAK